jgi:DNA polymerase-3 subunit alpha
MSFIHLQLYSAYSLLSSTISINECIDQAKSKGFKALALTDRNVMYGAVEFYKLCQKNGIKPILGLTVDVESDGAESSYPIVLLAENDMGFKNLLKISSAVQTREEKCIPIKWLIHYSKGLIAITPGIEGEIERNLLAEKNQIARELIQRYSGIFGKRNFFLSIQNHGLDQENKVRKELLLIANELNIPLVATNQVYFLDKEDRFAHECLLAIKNGDKLQDEHRERLGSDQYYLKSSAEMAEILSDYPDALENTLAIGHRCKVNIEKITVQNINVKITNWEKYNLDSFSVFQVEDSVKEDIGMMTAKDLETVYKSKDLIKKIIENKIVKLNGKSYKLEIKEMVIYTTLSIQLEIHFEK